MSALEVIGAVTTGSLLLGLILLLLTVALNIVCAAMGAVRFRRVLKAKTNNLAAWRWVVRQALKHWYGPRYNGDYGEYWQADGLNVPHDIRDPIRRSRW